MEIFDLEQGTEEWFRVRMGIPTASMFQTVISKPRGSDPEAKMRRVYMLKLIGERLTGEPSENYSNVHTERGHRLEPEARRLYGFINDVEPRQVGFIRTEVEGFPIGASPDSILGDDGALEIKTKLPHLHFEVQLGQELPAEHRAQCQGILMVSEREWIDFMSYWPKLRPFFIRVYRDESYIRYLRSGLVQFWEDLLRVEEILKSGNIDGPVLTGRPVTNPFSAEF